jgi:hypothetical protein
MENDVAPPTLPELDEHDIAAIEALLIRQVRAQDATARDREEVRAINVRIAENAKITGGIYQALSAVYGFVEPEDEDKNKWDLVRQAIGPDRYSRALALARGEEPPALLAQMGEQSTDEGEPTDTAPKKRSIPIRAAVLEYLRGLDGGATAREVRAHLLSAHGIETHEKTPGMTLYRLLKDGLVRRKGRTWFAVPVLDQDENEAPSGETAGASDAREGATSPNENQSTLRLIG